ncbi:S8 family serine peptidase [Fibrella sp. HMF5405]|uniref:S8 family serine peptidase n=2 Tax=Fibrella forsythiae TaxID=2817061 RepID=A0ABS3JFP8_9BACT|nr:S8 family serine peptidase [Fibrella forsythiae]
MPIFYRLTGFCLLLTGSVLAQPLPQYSLAQKNQLQILQQSLTQEQAANYQKAVTVAQQQGRAVEEPAGEGRIRRLRGIDEQTGNLLYDMVYFNARAANTTRTNSLYAGGSLGVNLNGSSTPVRNRLGIWDGGLVYAAHPEFGGRVIQQDNPTNTNRENEDVYHATHTSGTMIASGVNPLARGMAYGASLRAWDFGNDVSEMTTASADLLVSNHSYGSIAGWRFNSSRTTTNKWEWWGDTTLNVTQDYKFGLYDDNARSWDRIANASPYYLIVKSAGNDHAAGGPTAGQGYYLVQHNNRLSTVPRDQQFGYDQITTYGTAKNILSVGAVSNITNGYQRPSDVSLASFSSWGPTDDGRIKPDILGVGVNVISTASSTSFAYGALSGTSMSSPNVAGSVLLLQEYYGQLNPGKLMKAATLKGLVIHTANEAGPTTGPDYQTGWGLLNVERAARVIANTDKSNMLEERTLTQGQSYSVAIVASGRGPLVATICWSDPEGTVTTGSARYNDRTPKLVNDLDTRLTEGQATTFPWTLDPAAPDQAAKTGDNIRDNVEQVYIANPVPGRTYTLTISHKGTLTGTAGQAYALLVSGAGGTAYCASAATSSADSKIARVQFAGVNQAGADGCTTYSDFMSTTAVTDVQPSQPIPLTVITGTCGAAKPVVVKTYADWNANGTFTDPGELMGTSAVLNGPGTFISTIAAPSSVTAGTLVRLRIVAVETSDPNAVQPCGSYGNGETQEYLLRVVPAQTDVTVSDFVEGTPTLCANTQTVSVRVRNNGGTDQRNLPVTLQVTNAASQPVASLTSTVSLLRAYHNALVSFDLPASVSLAVGQTYQLLATISLAGDQDTTNNRLVASRTIGAGSVTGTFSAAACGSDPTVTLRSTSPSPALWYDSPTSGTLLAVGNQTSAAARSVYYVTTNDFAGRLGPQAKTDFQGGSYAGNFGPQPLISTKVPMRIDRARIYTGAAGRLTFQVRKFDETVISSTTIDVIATRTLPASQTNANGQQADDPNDVGAVYPLNLSIPTPGDYKISIEYEEGVTIFRSNSVTAGSGSSFAFPYTFRAQNGDVLASSKGALFDSGTSIDTLKAAWYYFYDMQLRPLDCPAAQRTAVTVTTRPSPTATIAAVSNATACQGGVISLRSTSTTATAGEVLTYQWLLNGQAIAGATSQSYAAGSSGQYALQVGSSCAPVTSSAVSVSIVQPQLPVIVQSGLVLTSNATTGNQWLLNGVPVTGATGQTYTAPQTGRYSVRANVNGCGDGISEELYVAILAVEPQFQASLRIYPNPTQSRITVDVAAPDSGPDPTVRLFDARGVLQQQVPMSRTLTRCMAILDLSNLPSGTFFVQVLTDTTQNAAVKAVLKY